MNDLWNGNGVAHFLINTFEFYLISIEKKKRKESNFTNMVLFVHSKFPRTDCSTAAQPLNFDESENHCHKKMGFNGYDFAIFPQLMYTIAPSLVTTSCQTIHCHTYTHTNYIIAIGGKSLWRQNWCSTHTHTQIT